MFRQLFCGDTVFVKFLFGIVVFRAPPPNVLLIVGNEYQDRVREGRGRTGMGERAAKGDGKGKTNGCQTTHVLFTTNNTRYITDHGAITRFPAYSHTNSAIFGTPWRRAKGSHGRVLCSIPTALAVHKSPSTTGGCGLTFALSKFVKETPKILLPVGSDMNLRRRMPSFSVSLKNHRIPTSPSIHVTLSRYMDRGGSGNPPNE